MSIVTLSSGSVWRTVECTHLEVDEWVGRYGEVYLEKRQVQRGYRTW